jgi:hypothetical protein
MEKPLGQPTNLPSGFRTPLKPSSNIKAFAWLGPAGEDLLREDLAGHTEVIENANQGKLCVRFVNGTRYDYGGVPQGMMRAMLKAESIGSFFNQNIRGNKLFFGAKVDPETGATLPPKP